MKQEDIEKVKEMLYKSEGFMGYAYLYPKNGMEREEFVFEMTPENIARFISTKQENAEKIVLTDMVDRILLDMTGNTVSKCKSSELKEQILSELSSVQKGEAGKKKFPLSAGKPLMHKADGRMGW